MHHQDFLPNSLSTHEALFFRMCRRDISEAHFYAFWRQALPNMPAMLAPRSTRRCKNRQKMLCCAMGCCSVRFALLWLARVLRRAGFRAFWRARASLRDPSHKTLLFTVFCCICVPGLFFWTALSGARATPCQPSGLGPGWGPEIWGWGGEHA